jgi:hypothetical protein
VRTVRNDDESGQVVPLMAAALALVVVALLALVPVARVLGDRARARTAADAAALAGAAEGETAARRLAAANGGRLTAFSRQGAEVVVHVRVGRADAWARAGTQVTAATICAASWCRRSGTVP